MPFATTIRRLRPPPRWSVQVRDVGLTAATVALIVGATRHGNGIEVRLTGAVAAALLLSVLMRHPTFSACTLLVFASLQVAVLSTLYAAGAPRVAVRYLGSTKDLAALALVLAAARVHTRARGDGSQRWTLLLLGVTTGYLVAPALLPQFAVLPFSERLQAWRLGVLALLALLALRRLGPERVDAKALRTTVLTIATVVGACGMYEYFRPHSFQTFLIDDIQIPRYTLDVLGYGTSAETLVRRTSDGTLRPGSLVIEPVFCAFLLLPGLFLAMSRVASQRSIRYAGLVAIIGGGVVVTGTRSALLGALVGATVATVRIATSQRVRSRAFIPTLAVILLVAPVVLLQSSAMSRFSAALAGHDSSTKDHRRDLQKGLNAALKHPLGFGLGKTAQIGQRFDAQNQITSENEYITITNEVGVLGLIAFVGFLTSSAIDARRSSRSTPDSGYDSAATVALVAGYLVGGVFQDVWNDYGTSVTAITVLALPTLAASRYVRHEHPVEHSALAGVSDA